MDAYQEAIEIIKTLLKSAVPNPVEHPTMTAAWNLAEKFLARHERVITRVDQVWVYQRKGLKPVRHLITLVEDDYCESTATHGDGTIYKNVILNGRGTKGKGFAQMRRGWDDVGTWILVHDPVLGGLLEKDDDKFYPESPKEHNLDMKVTSAVLLAEGALKEALFRFVRLLEAEQAILEDPDTQPIDREVATSGSANAKRILELLQKAWSEA